MMLYSWGKHLRRRAYLNRRGLTAALITLPVVVIGVGGGLGWARGGRTVLSAALHRAMESPDQKAHTLADSVGSAHSPAKITVAAAVTPATGQPAIVSASNCGSIPMPHVGLANATNPELRKLAQYEAVCAGAVAQAVSFFAPTPSTIDQAASYAQDIVATLHEYAQYGITPLVFLEPNGENGILNLDAYRAGNYDTALDAYFAAIKQGGVTDTMMGTWVVFPENNIPEWGSVDASTYVANVTRTIQFQKKYFPSSKSSIMLDSETYPSASSWSNGAYVSLLPYVSTIPKGLIDSFGLQGFPWTPPKGQSGAVLDPHVYLQVGLAAEAAHALGVTQVWLNTGTFSRAYAQNAAQTVSVSAADRQTMLQGVIAQANVLKQQGFTVAVHLFAQNKAATTEAIDWSYWDDQPSSSPDTPVFKTFAHDAHAANLQVWLFDTF